MSEIINKQLKVINIIQPCLFITSIISVYFAFSTAVKVSINSFASPWIGEIYSATGPELLNIFIAQILLLLLFVVSIYRFILIKPIFKLFVILNVITFMAIVRSLNDEYRVLGYILMGLIFIFNIYTHKIDKKII